MYFVIALCFHRGEDKVGILGNSINALPIYGQKVKKVGQDFKFWRTVRCAAHSPEHQPEMCARTVKGETTRNLQNGITDHGKSRKNRNVFEDICGHKLVLCERSRKWTNRTTFTELIVQTKNWKAAKTKTRTRCRVPRWPIVSSSILF